VNALPQYRVLPQISFGALLVPAVSGKDYNATRATFSQKIADFVVCDAAMQVIAIVELDDRTHNAEKDARRDAMLEDAGYSVVRFPSRHKPDSMKIRQVFQEIVAKRERVNHEGSNNVVAIRAT
jgi:very-short-patch-repair endonuclease